AAGATGKQGTAVAGSVAVTVSLNTTRTRLSNTTGSASGGVTLDAHDATHLISVAGSGAFGGKGAYGASIGYAQVSNTVESVVSNLSGFTHGGQFDVLATSSAQIFAVTGSLGVATGGGGQQGTAVAGTISVNIVDNAVVAKIE